MKKSSLLRMSALASLACAMAGEVPAAFAQAASSAVDGENSEIIVTAQKRAENAQNVPIAITALSNADLQATGVADTQSLRAAVPSLNVTTGVGGFGLPRIRGVGATGQGIGIENPVAVYVDGVYYAATFGVLQSLFDVEQVAVLKGPQGTLFGRNATGGLIQISTKGPSFDLEGKAQIGYGNYNTLNAGAYVSGGLSDTIAVSLSGQYENRDHGFGRNLTTGKDVQTNKQWAGRAKLLWKPSEDTSVLLSGDFNGRKSSEPAFRNFGLNSAGQNVTAVITSRGGDPDRDIIADVDPNLDADQWGTSLTVDHDFGGIKLKSISAYRRSELLVIFDPDGTERPTTLIGNHYNDKQFTQEINLISDDSGPFKWIFGGFYMWNQGYTIPRPTSVRSVFPGNYTDTVATSTLNSVSAFAEGTYALGEATNLTAGIRYTRDKRDLSVYTAAYNATTTLTTISPTTVDQRVFEKASWRISLDHRFSPELLAYVSYNRGFRSGSFIPQATPLIVLNPEVVDAYEVGIKSDLFDRKLRFNLAGYLYDQTNVQVMQIVGATQQVYNAKGARIYGLDADFSWQASDNLRFFGGINYTHARYTSFTDAIISIPYPVASTFTPTAFTYIDSATGTTRANTACLGTFGNPLAQLGGNCLIRGDATGNKLQNTPAFTASLGGALDIPTQIGKFTLSGNIYYNDGFVGSPDERVGQPSYTTMDTSLTWRHPNDHLSVQVWAKNLTDSFYRSQVGASSGGDNGTAGAPRTFGATLGVDF